jgi:hypothetical protein
MPQDVNDLKAVDVYGSEDGGVYRAYVETDNKYTIRLCDQASLTDNNQNLPITRLGSRADDESKKCKPIIRDGKEAPEVVFDDDVEILRTLADAISFDDQAESWRKPPIGTRFTFKHWTLFKRDPSSDSTLRFLAGLHEQRESLKEVERGIEERIVKIADLINSYNPRTERSISNEEAERYRRDIERLNKMRDESKATLAAIQETDRKMEELLNIGNQRVQEADIQFVSSQVKDFMDQLIINFLNPVHIYSVDLPTARGKVQEQDETEDIMAFAIQALYRQKLATGIVNPGTRQVQPKSSNDPLNLGFIDVPNQKFAIQRDFLKYGQLVKLGHGPDSFDNVLSTSNKWSFCRGGSTENPRIFPPHDVSVVCISYLETIKILQNLNDRYNSKLRCGDLLTEAGFANAKRTPGCFRLPSGDEMLAAMRGSSTQGPGVPVLRDPAPNSIGLIAPYGPPLAFSQGGGTAYGCIDSRCTIDSEFKFAKPKFGVFEFVGVRIVKSR